jgi:glycosyltransferase involved in cell wall biosynthesis
MGGYPPNSRFGGGLILRSLLSGYPRDRVAVVSNGSVMRSLQDAYGGGGLLDVAHTGIRPWRSRVRGCRRILRALNGSKALTSAIRAASLVRPDTAILAIPWGGELGSELFVAAYLAHRITRAPLLVYEMDEWRASLGPSAGTVCRVLERLMHGHILRAASTVWAISDPMARELEARFHVTAKILSHSVDIERYQSAAQPRRRRTGCFQLLYTGAVYSAQADAIRHVLQAISCSTDGFSLTIYTSQPERELTEQGISGPGLSVRPAVPLDQVPGVLSTADALLLPLSFDENQRTVVSTSFPTKTVDYLACGVPILVHAPPYAALTRLAVEEGWAQVVAQPSASELKSALDSLAADPSLRRRLSEKAVNVARARYDIGRVRAHFQSCIRESIRDRSRSMQRMDQADPCRQ